MNEGGSPPAGVEIDANEGGDPSAVVKTDANEGKEGDPLLLCLKWHNEGGIPFRWCRNRCEQGGCGGNGMNEGKSPPAGVETDMNGGKEGNPLMLWWERLERRGAGIETDVNEGQ